MTTVSLSQPNEDTRKITKKPLLYKDDKNQEWIVIFAPDSILTQRLALLKCYCLNLKTLKTYEIDLSNIWDDTKFKNIQHVTKHELFLDSYCIDNTSHTLYLLIQHRVVMQQNFIILNINIRNIIEPKLIEYYQFYRFSQNNRYNKKNDDDDGGNYYPTFLSDYNMFVMSKNIHLMHVTVDSLLTDKQHFIFNIEKKELINYYDDIVCNFIKSQSKIKCDNFMNNLKIGDRIDIKMVDARYKTDEITEIEINKNNSNNNNNNNSMMIKCNDECYNIEKRNICNCKYQCMNNIHLFALPFTQSLMRYNIDYYSTKQALRSLIIFDCNYVLFNYKNHEMLGITDSIDTKYIKNNNKQRSFLIYCKTMYFDDYNKNYSKLIVFGFIRLFEINNSSKNSKNIKNKNGKNNKNNKNNKKNLIEKIPYELYNIIYNYYGSKHDTSWHNISNVIEIKDNKMEIKMNRLSRFGCIMYENNILIIGGAFYKNELGNMTVPLNNKYCINYNMIKNKWNIIDLKKINNKYWHLNEIFKHCYAFNSLNQENKLHLIYYDDTSKMIYFEFDLNHLPKINDKSCILM